MPTSDDTILRCLKRRVKARGSEETARVVGVEDWAWREGSTYGTIFVDLERREVLDLFPERAAGMTADWLKRHPGIEIISRDRCGSFAQGAHEGAPQARQFAEIRRPLSYPAEPAEPAGCRSGATRPYSRVFRASIVADGRRRGRQRER
jgi:transposase